MILIKNKKIREIIKKIYNKQFIKYNRKKLRHEIKRNFNYNIETFTFCICHRRKEFDTYIPSKEEGEELIEILMKDVSEYGFNVTPNGTIYGSLAIKITLK